MNNSLEQNYEAYRSSVVCILSVEQNIIGLGFLVSDKHMVTCAHVVADALGILRQPNELLNQDVTINFPFHPERGNFCARVVIWQPEEFKDVACLEFIGKQPRDFAIAPYRSDSNLWGHKFGAFGYPINIDAGGWVHGTMSAPIPSGWIQVETDGNPGMSIKRGFSGTPVWDETLNCVVGIVVAQLQSDEQGIAYVIPIEKLSISFNAPLNKPDRLPSKNNHLIHTNYKLEQNFTGRSTELRKLSQWFNTPGLPILELNGAKKTGKTALVYYWLHYYAFISEDWTVLWLSFDVKNTSLYFFAFKVISELLLTPSNPIIQKDQYFATLNQFVQIMKQRKILFVMDQFELQLSSNKKLRKKYSNKDQLLNQKLFASKRSCIDKYVVNFLKALLSLQNSKVIIISREKVKDLEDENKQPYHGCQRENLDMLDSQDAIDFLRYQGVREGDDSVLLDVCKQFHNNPDTLRMLSSIITSDGKTPGNISVVDRPQVKSLFQLYNSTGFQLAISPLSPFAKNIVRTSIRTAARSSFLNVVIQTILRTWSMMTPK